MNWLIVFIAGLLEIVWASYLKYADSYFDWIMTIVLIGISFILLIRAYRTIPVAIAFTVFVGIGTIGTYIVGVFLGEPYTIRQLFSLLVLLTGVVGVKVFTKSEEAAVRSDD
jgi:paired small multidrug resistance pump